MTERFHFLTAPQNDGVLLSADKERKAFRKGHEEIPYKYFGYNLKHALINTHIFPFHFQ